MPEPMRRLEIRLPGNHPVFSIEAGKRNQIITEWLDIGRQVVGRLTEIENMLKNGTQITQPSQPDQHRQPEPAKYDKDEYLSYFDNM